MHKLKELDTKEFGNRLKKLAKRQYGTVVKLGELLGNKNLSNYTSGTREPGANILYKLHQVGIDINELLGIEDLKSVNLSDIKNKNGVVTTNNTGTVQITESSRHLKEIITEKERLIESQAELILHLKKTISLYEKGK